MRVFGRLLSLVLALISVAAHADDALESPRLAVELNAVRTVDSACRLTFVLRNEMGLDLESFAAETVVFSTDGTVELLTVLDFGDLPAGRPRVRQFDMAGLACEDVGMVLLNGADTCLAAGGDATDCEAALALSSRVGIPFEG